MTLTMFVVLIIDRNSKLVWERMCITDGYIISQYFVYKFSGFSDGKTVDTK